MKKTFCVYSGIVTCFLILVAFASCFLPTDARSEKPLSYSRKNLYFVLPYDGKVQCENRLHDIYRLMRLYSLDKVISAIPTDPSSIDLQSGSADPKDYCRSWRSVLAALDNEQKGTSFIYFETYTTYPCREWEIVENHEVRSYFQCESPRPTTSSGYCKCNTDYLLLTRSTKTLTELPDTAVIVVESADCGIHWMEPRDLDIQVLLDSDTPFGVGKLNAYHEGYVSALRKNGELIHISKNWNKEKVLAVLEVAEI